jgi:hypothetical protein
MIMGKIINEFWNKIILPFHYRALLSFPHVFSGNPGKIKRMDARLIHSGMTNCPQFVNFRKMHGSEFALSRSAGMPFFFSKMTIYFLNIP